MKILITLITFISISSVQAQGLVSPIVEDMHKSFKDKDFKKLRSRGLIVRKKNINKSAWPELTIYMLIEADPLESISTFAAFEHQKNYVPGLIKSKVIKQLSPTEVHTQYEMKMPWPIPNSKYVHATKLEQMGEGEYKMNWHMIESNSADIVKGFAEFHHLDIGKTVLKYRSFINPKSFLAGLFKKSMISDVEASLVAIRSEIEKVKNTPQGNKFKGLIGAALSGKYAYPTGQPVK